MRVESDRNDLMATLFSQLSGFFHDRSVPQMHAVEVTYDQNAALCHGPRIAKFENCDEYEARNGSISASRRLPANHCFVWIHFKRVSDLGHTPECWH